MTNPPLLCTAATTILLLTGCSLLPGQAPVTAGRPTQPAPTRAPQAPGPTAIAEPEPGHTFDPSTDQPASPAPAQTMAPRPTGAPAPTRPAGQVVDAARYRAAGGWFFVSPSRNLYCAIVDQPGDGVAVGCQAGTNVAGQSCAGDGRAPAAWLPVDRSRPAGAGCVDGPTYVGPQENVLPYGSVLVVAGHRCESTQAGVRCTVDGGTRGFTIAREGITTSR